MTFANYIREQYSRLDLVGDLARYLTSGKPRIGGYLQIKDYLFASGAADDLHEALEQAYDELAVAESRRHREQLVARR